MYLKELQVANDELNGKKEERAVIVEDVVQPMDTTSDTVSTIDIVSKRTANISSQKDTPDVPIRFPEKKRLDWAGKTCM